MAEEKDLLENRKHENNPRVHSFLWFIRGELLRELLTK